MNIRKISPKDNNNTPQPNQETPTRPISTYTAAYQVLNLPELLEEIILYDLTTITTIATTRPSHPRPHHWVNNWDRLTHLRQVCKTWSIIIDFSPKLGRLVYRYPKICTYVKIENLSLCEPFLWSLCCKMKKMSEIRDWDGFGTVTEFDGFVREIAPSGGYVASNVFVSQPAVQAVYIRFSGLADSTWLKDYEAFIRPVDYSRISSGRDYSYHYAVINNRDSGGGVTAEDLVNSLILVIGKFFSFGGGFRNLTIDLAVGNSMIFNGHQFLSIVSSRRMWEPSWSARKLDRAPLADRAVEQRAGIGSNLLKRISGVFSRDLSFQRRSLG
ncbi:hypothetical protein TWF506_008174 [Arthrobotrys conoides]|uniref:F-box domain-containing protein n=1 Tax=Arthrobotrys conoides TaxID=74498 RepID=A0AAN8RTP1_9PEZI